MVDLLRQTYRSYRIHDGRLLSGAIAFYTLLATAPLGVLAVVALAVIIGPRAARGELQEQLAVRIGPQVAQFVVNVVAEAARPRSSVLATLIGAFVLAYASYRLFDMLRSALNHVWGVRCAFSAGLRGDGRKILLRRAAGFSIILVLGAAVWAEMILNVTIGALGRWFDGVSLLLRALHHVTSLAVLTGVVLLVFRLLPDVRVGWRDGAVGAAATAVLVTVGSFVVSEYFARFSPTSSYGAAGSVVALLLFVYYVAQAFFVGAEFTRVWAEGHGHGMMPLPHAVRVDWKERQTIDVMEES